MLRPGNVVAIEGITGIGKSNLGQELALALSESGVRSRWYFELEFANPLIPKHHDHRIIESAIDSWQAFLSSNDFANQVSVVDGRLFLINIVWSLQHGIPSEEIELRLRPLAKLAGNQSVSLIYLRSKNLEKLFSNTFEKRSSEAWYVENCEPTAYCRNNGYVGRGSVIKFYSEVDRIMTNVIGSFGGNAQVIDVDVGDWKSATQQVLSGFGLVEPNRHVTSRLEAEQLVGTYVGEFNGLSSKFVVVYEDGELAITDHPYTVFKPVEQKWRLCKVGHETYLGKGHPVKLRFVIDGSNKVVGLFHSGMYDEPQSGVSELNRSGLFERRES